MNRQLSFLEPLPVRRKYIRDRNGRFANKQRLEIEETERKAQYYKSMYETERRKLKPLIRRLISVERELHNIKHRI